MLFEPLIEFIQRLEEFTGSVRIKVPQKQNDPKGNPILPVRGIYLLDEEGGVHESVTTDGVVRRVSWPDGSTVQVTGTFTKTVGGGTGSLIIAPPVGDEAIIKYGRVSIGPVQAGGAAPLTVFILDNTLTIMAPLADLNMTINQILNLPTAFADAAVAVANPIGTPTIHQLMIDPNHALQVALAGMAVAEVFSVVMTFRSLAGTAPGVVPIGGTFA